MSNLSNVDRKEILRVITTSIGSSFSAASFFVFLAFEENDNTAFVTLKGKKQE